MIKVGIVAGRVQFYQRRSLINVAFFYLGSDVEVIYEKEGLGSFAINHDKAVIWLTDISNNKLIEINIIGEDKKTR